MSAYLTVLTDVSEQHAPPSSPVLVVSVVDDVVCLEIAEATCAGDGTITELSRIAAVTVDRIDLVRVLADTFSREVE